MEKKNIHTKLLSVMKKVGFVPKDGQADYGEKYFYVSHDQVVRLTRDALVEEGVYVSTDIIEHDVQVLGDPSKPTLFTVVKTRISFINSENPEDRIEFFSYGYGLDRQDKGIGKAISYSKKYGLLLGLLLETGDDPEKDAIDMPAGSSIKTSELYPGEEIVSDEIPGKFWTVWKEDRREAKKILGGENLWVKKVDGKWFVVRKDKTKTKGDVPPVPKDQELGQLTINGPMRKEIFNLWNSWLDEVEYSTDEKIRKNIFKDTLKLLTGKDNLLEVTYDEYDDITSELLAKKKLYDVAKEFRDKSEA